MRQVWRLVDQSGIPGHCFLKERDGRWLVFVRTGNAITLYSRCSSHDSAVQRANQIRKTFTGRGWREQGTDSIGESVVFVERRKPPATSD
jgi:hypothetical protein